jgi:hypothetical protein
MLETLRRRLAAVVLLGPLTVHVVNLARSRQDGAHE